MGYRRLFIVRKDLNMTAGKLAAMIGHCAEAYWTRLIRDNSMVFCLNKYRAYDIAKNGERKPMLYKRNDLCQWSIEAFNRGEDYFYSEPVDPNNRFGKHRLCEPKYEHRCDITFDDDVYEQYIAGSFVKTICEAKTKNHLLKAKVMADEIGLVENIDYGLIYDNCRTELIPEELDGTTLTGIWFKPLPDEIAHQISKKYQLYK